MAVTDCLNFGNPEKPQVMWQFKRAIDGMCAAVLKLNTPVVSGNVSFYNETEDKAIYPTPTIGMVGLIEDVNKHLTQWFKNTGDIVVLLGETKEELGGSEYLKQIHGMVLGTPPELDLDSELSLINTLLEASGKGIINSAHDLSEGGIAVGLAECCFTPNGPLGVNINLPLNQREDALLFSESQSRAIVSLDETELETLKDTAQIYGTPIQVIGRVEGTRLSIENLIDLHITKAYDAWASGFESKIKSYA